MGVGSVIPLASTNLPEVKIVLQLHRTANEMSNLALRKNHASSKIDSRRLLQNSINERIGCAQKETARFYS